MAFVMGTSRAGAHRTLFAVAGLIPVAVTLLGLAIAAGDIGSGWGMDFLVYWDAARRWADGGSYYLPWQLAGPYLIHGPDSQLAVLHPPTFVLVSAPFALLPRDVAALFWTATPIIVTAWAVRRMRPPPWSWPVLGLLVAWPPTAIAIATGNATLAGTAALAVALATRHRWIAGLVLLKPSLAPFAIFGIRSRAWWIVAVTPAVASLPFASLWSDWFRAIANAQDGGLLYSLPHVPIVALPVVAWLSSRHGSVSPPARLDADGTLTSRPRVA